MTGAVSGFSLKLADPNVSVGIRVYIFCGTMVAAVWGLYARVFQCEDGVTLV
jgi:hypothetical protein